MRSMSERKAKKRKPKAKAKRFPMLGRSVHDRLYRAVVNYVEAHGGMLVVVGGVEVQQWMPDRPSSFKIAVSCAGRAPTYKAKD
jgi:hypothetical protein